MGEVVQLRDFYLKKLTRDAEALKGELVEFAKQGEPTVANVDPYAGCHCPEGIDGLMYETSMGYVPTPWDVG